MSVIEKTFSPNFWNVVINESFSRASANHSTNLDHTFSSGVTASGTVIRLEKLKSTSMLISRVIIAEIAALSVRDEMNIPMEISTQPNSKMPISA